MNEKALLEKGGLILEFPSDLDLERARAQGFHSGWNAEKIDAHLKHLFPQMFEWQARNLDVDTEANEDLSESEYVWVLLSKEQRSLVPYAKLSDEISGHDLARVKGAAGKKWTQNALYFGELI